MGVDPRDMRSFDEFNRLPFVSKDQLRARPIEERLSNKFSAHECRASRTSGSTGQPLLVLDEPAALDLMRAYQLRRVLSYGFKPWEKIAVLDPRREKNPSRGSALRNPFTRFLPFGGGLYHIPMRSPSEQLQAIYDLNPRGVWALPSAMLAMASALDMSASKRLNFRGILSWGELLSKRKRDYIEEKFGAQVYDGYGSVEVAPLGGLAWECNDHGFHINADCVILEFIKDGERVSPGEEGEIVATSLYKYAMPTIRYRLHDLGSQSEETCSCGRNLPLIGSLEGRQVDCLVADSGELVSPFRIIVALERIEGVDRYQLIQNELHQLTVRIESTPPMATTIGEKIESVCKSLIGDNTKITLEYVSNIAVEPDRKFRPVICNVHHET